MSHLWKKVKDGMVDENSINIVLVPSKRYQDSRHLLQNPKVPRTVRGFNNRTQRFTGSNYLDVDTPFTGIILELSLFYQCQFYSVLIDNSTFHFCDNKPSSSMESL